MIKASDPCEYGTAHTEQFGLCWHGKTQAGIFMPDNGGPSFTPEPLADIAQFPSLFMTMTNWTHELDFSMPAVDPPLNDAATGMELRNWAIIGGDLDTCARMSPKQTKRMRGAFFKSSDGTTWQYYLHTSLSNVNAGIPNATTTPAAPCMSMAVSAYVRRYYLDADPPEAFRKIAEQSFDLKFTDPSNIAAGFAGYAVPEKQWVAYWQPSKSGKKSQANLCYEYHGTGPYWLEQFAVAEAAFSGGSIDTDPTATISIARSPDDCYFVKSQPGITYYTYTDVSSYHSQPMPPQSFFPIQPPWTDPCGRTYGYFQGPGKAMTNSELRRDTNTAPAYTITRKSLLSFYDGETIKNTYTEAGSSRLYQHQVGGAWGSTYAEYVGLASLWDAGDWNQTQQSVEWTLTSGQFSMLKDLGYSGGTWAWHHLNDCNYDNTNPRNNIYTLLGYKSRTGTTLKIHCAGYEQTFENYTETQSGSFTSDGTSYGPTITQTSNSNIPIALQEANRIARLEYPGGAIKLLTGTGLIVPDGAGPWSQNPRTKQICSPGPWY